MRTTTRSFVRMALPAVVSVDAMHMPAKFSGNNAVLADSEPNEPLSRAANNARPNIVFILADDLNYKMVMEHAGKQLDGTVFMPNLASLLMARGLNFHSHYISFSVCCPSRATILRGQYPHNTGILGNAPPLGGFPTFFGSGKEGSTVATWLQAAGYKTVLIGKYLNGYPKTASLNHVPPGWTEWYVHNSEPTYYNYTWIENGVAVQHGSAPTDYLTDTITAKASAFLERTSPSPFFMYVAPYAPHVPAIPAPGTRTCLRTCRHHARRRSTRPM